MTQTCRTVVSTVNACKVALGSLEGPSELQLQRATVCCASMKKGGFILAKEAALPMSFSNQELTAQLQPIELPQLWHR